MNENIIKFISKQTCASLCVIDQHENSPYCFSCFYAFNARLGLLYFKSSPAAHHSSLIAANPSIAGTILPDKLNVLQIRGIQFEGTVLPDDHELVKDGSAQYHKQHPMALAMSGEIWTIQINEIKMTDNSLGFGKKITWERNELVS